jgi:subtilisin family serine protease
VHSGLPPSSCPADSPEPCDDNLLFPHGTHVMGIALGDDGASNQIGVSPDASLMGCRSVDLLGGTPARYIECFQWLLAPTDLQGMNPDPSKAPHVINNSWVCTPGEGCSLDTLQTVVDAVRAAGIVVTGAGGNSGPDCSTIDLSPAIYASTFTVGSTDASDAIAGSSSRGPVTADGSGRLKPEITAPGVGVRSAVGILDIIGGGTIFDYLVASGTSMAAPHVAGAVALLLDAQPDLIGRVDEIEALLEMSAFPLGATQSCGGISPGAVPNNVYGHGRLDVLELITGDADADGVGNAVDCAPVDSQSWAEPGQVTDLTLDGSTPTTLGWSSPASPGGNAVEYDLLRSESPADFTAATCIESGITTPGSSDGATPGGAFFYLVRVRNVCGENAGEAWNGPRAIPSCGALP